MNNVNDPTIAHTVTKNTMINELISYSCFYNCDKKKLQRLSYKEVYNYYRLFMW